MLVEVKAQLVELARPSVEHHGVEVDRPQVDELHELPPDLAKRQLGQLWPDRHQEVTLVVGEGSGGIGRRSTRETLHKLIKQGSDSVDWLLFR